MTMIFKFVGLDDIWGDEPTKLNDKLNTLITKVTPAFHTLKDVYGGEAKKGIKKMFRKN